MMDAPTAPSARRGFTIVELLVTVAVIAILMGLLVGGLRGALGSAKKTKELNGLRGVHAAWYQYANSYEENLLPGFLDEQAQVNWKVSYSNMTGQQLPREQTQTYPWRLARFMDNPYGTLGSYLEGEASDQDVDGDGQPDAPGDEASQPWDDGPAIPAWATNAIGRKGSLIGLQPAFSYNAYYIGGWYESNGAVSVPRFSDATWTRATGGGQLTGGLVSTKLAGISRTTEVIVFASGTYRPVGNYKSTANPEDRVPGCAWIVPPVLAQSPVWEPFAGNQEGLGAGAPFAPFAPLAPQAGLTDTGVLGVRVTQGVPVRRYNNLVAIIRADGSTESMSIGALMDMRMWIDAADRGDFTHNDN